MRIKYTVKIGYYRYNFTDRGTALLFAERALIAKEDKDHEVLVELTICDDETEDE